MEADGDRIAEDGYVGAALADGAVAVGEFDAAGTVAHEFDDAALGADFVGVGCAHAGAGVFCGNNWKSFDFAQDDGF
jgi:hypothetical protein